MRRLRFFRILLPALLVPFLVLVGLEIKRRPKPWGDPAERARKNPRAEGIVLEDIQGTDEEARLNYRIVADEASADNQRGLESFKGVEEFKIGRRGALPLLVSADRAYVDGKEPNRTITIRGGIEVRDDDAGLWLYLPELKAEEATGLARSVGEVRFEATGYRGWAETLVYGLYGQPTEFIDLRITSEDGWELVAHRALLVEGTDEIDLRDGVTLRNGEDRISAVRMLVKQDADGALESVLAEGGVSGAAVPEGRPRHTFKSETAEMRWEDGEKAYFSLSGQAVLHIGQQGLAASSIVASRREDAAGGWDLSAAGGVFARGPLRGQPAELHADRLELSLDSNDAVIGGGATGAVRFRNGPTESEAAHAEIRPGGQGLEVVLLAEGDRRARLVGQRHRVTADRIVTRAGTGYLEATGGVNAVLLPSDDLSGERPGSGLFLLEEAVHFVSRRMESAEDGDRLTFAGSVRGWQGERNLSAEKVTITGGEGGLTAEGSVTTRIPREAGTGVTQSEYIQVSSERLDYNGEIRQALFREQVRVRQAEGWMESDRLEVDLQQEGGGIEMLRSFGNVRIEYRAPTEAGVPQPIYGTADRVEYSPSEARVRLFGDETFATVSRSGPEGVKTEGRVIRYQLDTGRIDVESGDTDRGKIRTSGS